MNWESIKHSGTIILAIAGGAGIIFGLIQTIFSVVPGLMEVKSKVWAWFANKYRYRKFKKLAIKSDIENVELHMSFLKPAKLRCDPRHSFEHRTVDMPTKQVLCFRFQAGIRGK